VSDTSTFPPADGLATLAQVLRQIARRHRLTREDTEDFLQTAHLKLIERDYEVFRRFKGRSSLRTYLLVVCTRLLLDWRVERYGKWRPSTTAIRLGEAAVVAERLMYRDGFSVNGAFETVRLRFPAMDTTELQRIFDLLPPRECRRIVSDQMLEEVAAPPVTDPLEAFQRAGAARHIGDALQQAVKALPPDDQRLLRDRYTEGRTIPSLAETLGVEPKALYRRFDTMLRRLRRALAQAGVTSPVTIATGSWKFLAERSSPAHPSRHAAPTTSALAGPDR
jgi:RNA polymerase sigma factor (sigma-70 family)